MYLLKCEHNKQNDDNKNFSYKNIVVIYFLVCLFCLLLLKKEARDKNVW